MDIKEELQKFTGLVLTDEDALSIINICRRTEDAERRTKFWMDSMLAHMRTDKTGYAIPGADDALEYFDKKIKNGQLE